jgi:predicted acylesterase/phospholipase RssA
MADPAKQPVSVVDINTDATHIELGIALCLSGGGYRAMIFHLGALIRLNEIALLAKLNRVSSVSGGSITAAQLGLKWRDLQFENGVAKNLKELVIDPIRKLGERTIDVSSVIGGILTPGVTGPVSPAPSTPGRPFPFRDEALGDDWPVAEAAIAITEIMARENGTRIGLTRKR